MNEILNQISERISKIESENRKSNVGTIIALADGVDLIGYCPWSFMDLVSTHQGYGKRYGFVYVDRGEDDIRSLARIPKDSFAWYRHVIETNGAEL